MISFSLISLSSLSLSLSHTDNLSNKLWARGGIVHARNWAFGQATTASLCAPITGFSWLKGIPPFSSLMISLFLVVSHRYILFCAVDVRKGIERRRASGASRQSQSHGFLAQRRCTVNIFFGFLCCFMMWSIFLLTRGRNIVLLHHWCPPDWCEISKDFQKSKSLNKRHHFLVGSSLKKFRSADIDRYFSSICGEINDCNLK